MRTGEKEFLRVAYSDVYGHMMHITLSSSSVFRIYCERKNLRKGRDAYTLMCYIDSRCEGSFLVGRDYNNVKLNVAVEFMHNIELFTENKGLDLYAEVQFLEGGIMKKSKVYLTPLRDLFSEYGYYKYESKYICQDYMT